MKRSKTRSGFTLLEISIVLTIIGLLAGGVLVGQHLIWAAQVSRAASDLRQLSTMIGAFQTKYNCLPGDCANARTLFPDCSPDQGWGTGFANTCNGNGDGMYNIMWEGTVRLYEHLRLAGMTFHTQATGQADMVGTYNYNANIPGVNIPDLDWLHNGNSVAAGIYAGYQYFCTSGTSGCEGFQPGMASPLNQREANRLFIAPLRAGANQGVFWLQDGGMSWKFARALDMKVDDGMPLTGHITAYEVLGGGEGFCTANQGNLNEPYVDPSVVWSVGYCPIAYEIDW